MHLNVFFISHNSELPQSDCDIILLKNDNSDEGSHPTGNHYMELL